MQRSTHSALAFLVLLLRVSSFAQSASKPAISPVEFVQGFYNWYTPLALEDKNPPTWSSALKIKAKEFAPPLLRLLREDATAQSKCRELISLDFDPFLNTQEPADHYEAAAISRKGSTYAADVYSVRFGKRSDKPDVVVEFVQGGAGYHFTNFLYPADGTDLLAILRSPRPECTAPRNNRGHP